jgi:DNA-binding transcriptional LysR family regulator
MQRCLHWNNLRMDQLKAMRVFARVVDEGSLAGAARALDLAPAVVTRLLADLEAHLGARLLNRTTRRIALTDIGEAYLERTRSILIEVEESEALASESTKNPRGHLRILTPPAMAVHQLAKHLPRFQALYPDVTVEIHAPGPVETVDEDYDLTVVNSRHPLTGDFIARRLARTEFILCAAPEYLDRRGRPEHPRELLGHEALLPPLADVQRGVTFYAGPWGDDEPGGESYVLVPQRRAALSTSHLDTTYAAALAGLGVGAMPSFMIEDALLEHALERVLPAWRLFHATIWIAMPTRRHVPARTRVFIDFLVETFGGEDKDPWLAGAGCATQPLPPPTPRPAAMASAPTGTASPAAAGPGAQKV